MDFSIGIGAFDVLIYYLVLGGAAGLIWVSFALMRRGSRK